MSSEIKLRVSALSHWSDCPRRGAANSFRDIIKTAGYVLIDGRRSVSSAIGTAVHAGAAHTLREKKQARSVSVAETVDVSMAKLDEEAREGVEFDSVSPSRNDSEHQVRTIAEVFYRDVAPGIVPVEIEHPLSGTASYDGMIVRLTGHPDAIEADAIHDYKTSKSPTGYHSQLGGYHILASTPEYGFTVSNLKLDWLPRVPVHKTYPGAKTFEYPVGLCVAEAKAVIRAAMVQVRNFMDTKEPTCFPANRSSILCSAKFCPAFGTDFCEVSKL